MPVIDTWKPKQYESFNHLRLPALEELLTLIQPTRDMKVIDMGAGSGDFTCRLFDALRPQSLLGVECSDEMRALGEARRQPGMQFVPGDINTFDTGEKFDLVFSNGVLMYAVDQKAALKRFRSWLNDGGQIAIQLPANRDTYPIAMGYELARTLFASYCPTMLSYSGALRLDDYAQCLHDLGFVQQVVKTHAHSHPLATGHELYAWLEQTFINSFESEMPPDVFREFKREYTELFTREIPFDRPYFYVLKRLYLWARLGN